MTPSRSPHPLLQRGTTLAALLLGAGVGFVASSQPWWRASGDGAAVSFTGSDVTGGLGQALAAVALAGVLLVLVLKTRGRRVLAVLLALTGLGLIAAGVLQTAPDAETVRNRVRQVSLTDQFALTTTPWPWVSAAAGLIVLGGAVLLWCGSPGWTVRASRFERPTPGSPPVRDLAEDPARVWKELDGGLDPTEDAGDSPKPSTPADPDVRESARRVTMEPTHEQKLE